MPSRLLFKPEPFAWRSQPSPGSRRGTVRQCSGAPKRSPAQDGPADSNAFTDEGLRVPPNGDGYIFGGTTIGSARQFKRRKAVGLAGCAEPDSQPRTPVQAGSGSPNGSLPDGRAPG